MNRVQSNVAVLVVAIVVSFINQHAQAQSEWGGSYTDSNGYRADAAGSGPSFGTGSMRAAPPSYSPTARAGSAKFVEPPIPRTPSHRVAERYAYPPSPFALRTNNLLREEFFGSRPLNIGQGYGTGYTPNFFGNFGIGYGVGESRNYFGNPGIGYGLGESRKY